jgi:hypothetical protein
MVRAVGLTLGLVLVMGAGWAHGVWTQRWSKSADFEAAVARMAQLPEDLDGWKAEPAPEDHEALTEAGAEGWWTRRYTCTRTGDQVLVVLLCGRSGRMCVHRPEYCYSGAGFELSIPPERYTLPGEDAAFWTARFSKPQVGGPLHLRIFWSWFGGGAWHAPDSPRWSLAHLPALYKLYVIREVSGAPAKAGDDPAAAFLGVLTPALTRTLGGR